MRIVTGHSPEYGLRATIQIETTSPAGVRKLHAFTSRSFTTISDLQAALRLAGDEARRYDVEAIIR